MQRFTNGQRGRQLSRKQTCEANASVPIVPLWDVPPHLQNETNRSGKHATEHANAIHEPGNNNVLAHVRIGPKEHQKAHSTRHQQTSEHRTSLQRAVHKQLGNGYARPAVGYEANQCGQKRCEHGLRRQERSQRVLAYSLNYKAKHKRYNKDERRDLNRMH